MFCPPNAVEPCRERNLEDWQRCLDAHEDDPTFAQRWRHALFWKHLRHVTSKIFRPRLSPNEFHKLTREVVEFRPFNEYLMRSFSEIVCRIWIFQRALNFVLSTDSVSQRAPKWN